MLMHLIHNGVVVPEPPTPLGLTLTVKGNPVLLTPTQEEMALAWAKKQGTPYVEDRAFVQNFMADFSQALALDEAVLVADVDFGPAVLAVEAERQAKAGIGPEQRRSLVAERKAQRQALREKYGVAIVDGERVDLANYVVEPSGIFMGRGQHPLRGRWKAGARHQDITLNLSPDAPHPPGEWAGIVWQPESLWVARWEDKLSGKLKYVWLSDTASVKQVREATKFDRAHDLHAKVDRVRLQIEHDLANGDRRRRMVATACYLIDALCLRVGDEKDPDEADTVGATTLRPEHVTLLPNGKVEFRFLGKDSVLWHKQIHLPVQVRANLEELIEQARPSSTAGSSARAHPTRDKPQLFPTITSRTVNSYLSGILPGLTAKVFRTHHATVVVQEKLEQSGVEPDDPDYLKWEAANLANLAAAELCNHTKQAPANWSATRQRFKERRDQADQRVTHGREVARAAREALAALRLEARDRIGAAPEGKREQVRGRYQKRIEVAERRAETAKKQLDQARLAQGRLQTQATVAAKKRTWNLGTSLKSYIDPRVFYRWGRQVDYDVLGQYYPTALRLKFAWVRQEDDADLP